MAANSGSYHDFDKPTEAGKRRARIAELLIGQGTSTAPVQHWTQAAARAMQGAMGGYAMHQAEQQENAARQQRSSADQKIVDALLGVLGPPAQQGPETGLDPVTAALVGQPHAGPPPDVHDPQTVRPPTPVSPTGEEGLFEGAPDNRNAVIGAEPAGQGLRPVQPMGGGQPLQTGGVLPQPVPQAPAPQPRLQPQTLGPQPPSLGPPRAPAQAVQPPPGPHAAQPQQGMQVDSATRRYVEALLHNPQTRSQGVALMNSLMQEQRKANRPLSPLERMQLEKNRLEVEKLQLDTQAKAREGAKIDNLGQNISGGLDHLARIPSEFGDWTFESSVGRFQGDPNSYIGSVARGLGSVWNTFGGRHTSEVRNRIAGDTEALAAAIKPLIRAPGEGPWTDKDQERLVAVVGNLAQAHDAEEYYRALEGVRQRVAQNFGIQLPAINIPGRGQSPAQGPRSDAFIGVSDDQLLQGLGLR